MEAVLFNVFVLTLGRFSLKAQNVGIGTSSPQAKLHVKSSQGMVTTFYEGFNDGVIHPTFHEGDKNWQIITDDPPLRVYGINAPSSKSTLKRCLKFKPQIIMIRLTIFFIFSIFTLVHCNSPKSKSISSDLEKVEVVEKTSIAKTESEEKGEVENLVEKEKTTETNLYMDPFDPDFISGRWESEDQNGFSFSAWFYVEDGYVSGQYCAINEDASRIDCGTPDEIDVCYIKSPYLVGKKILELEFVSCYAQKKGRAIIEPYGDGDIRWRLLSSPGAFGVDHFAPEEAILYKVSFDPFE